MKAAFSEGSGDDGQWQLNGRDVVRRTDDSLEQGPYLHDVCTGRGVAGSTKADARTDKLSEGDGDKGEG